MTGGLARWRPGLGLVVFVMLATVLCLPLVGLYFFRIDENQLVRQTEAELIAEAATLAPRVAGEIEVTVPPAVPLGAPATPLTDPTPDSPYNPILPVLTLGGDTILGRRPDGKPPVKGPDPAFWAVGARLSPALVETQRITLIGVRLLDPSGTVIAGREEVGQSLADIPEVAEALAGRFKSVLRNRAFEHEPPPLYSVSRGTGTRVFIALPVVVRGHVAAVIYLSRTPNNVMKQLYGERRQVLLAAGSVGIATLLIGVLFRRMITRPVRDLIARTAELEQGAPDALRPFTHQGTAEIARLAASFLGMAENLRRRSAFITTFTAHVSHELKSPLTSIKGAAELLRDDLEGEGPAMPAADRRRFLDNIISDTGRLSAMVGRLRDLARAEAPPTTGTGSVAGVLAGVQAAAPRLVIVTRGETARTVAMSGDSLDIVLGHLADNAAAHGARRIDLDGACRNGLLVLTVRDDGAGISASNRDKVFENFFTTRRESGGTGMGLPIVRAMLTAHGGRIGLGEGGLGESGGGACFVLEIPLAPSA